MMMLRRNFLMIVAACGLLACGSGVMAQEDGGKLAAQLAAARQDGTSDIRLRMEVKGGDGTVLQIQVKSRRAAGATDVMYRVLWPKESKAQAVYLSEKGGQRQGTVIDAAGKMEKLSGEDWGKGVFGTVLAYEDVLSDFYAWPSQTALGHETVDGVDCVILESKPGKTASVYRSVKSWVDAKRLVPLRVEKYGSSALVRRIDSTRVVKTEGDRYVTANLLVRQAGQSAVTEVDGSKIRRDVSFTDADFVPKAGE